MAEAETDVAFVDQVRAALAAQVGAVVGEASGDAWRGMQHRPLAERIKVLVAAACGAAGYAGDADLLDHGVRLAGHLRELQGPGGLFSGGDNVDSPPDSAFSVNDLADALLMLRRADGSAHLLAKELEHLLVAATPALVSGGVHTPNHRWELSAALARLFRVAPEAVRPELADRVEQWLAEGVDIDGDGLYSERSAGYAAFVSNPSLLAIAEVFDRPELVDAVERNLDATLDLLLPDGTVETVLSRRQDQRFSVTLSAYLMPLRHVARVRGRADLAWAAGLALEQGILQPAEAATRLVLDPGAALALPAAAEPARTRQRVFSAAGLLVDHRPTTTTVVFGGSDFPRHRHIRSGLANSPTFLRLFAGAAVLDSVRLSRTFFSHGPFRPDGLAVERDAAGATTATLAETVSAAYYQPLAPAHHDPDGDYRLVDEGRFSAAMDFGRRTQDEVTLATTVTARLTSDGVELTLDLTGASVDWALELAFRPGGTLAGAHPLGGDRWRLDAGTARYEVDGHAITVALVDGPETPALAAPAYEPGEEYRYLGGTDAATGQLLYVTGRVPTRVRLLLAGSAP
ncbi:hypothetical protein [Micromonospora sp. CPCC 206061]|uniref:hypothetical protein n=1 Tax=Micromonospora sp. CPCC 206061 TaxID=3122410 RepID=UPI002FF254FD